ncbi:lytic transglycosylase domain-containing protein [Pseudomonas veronii]|uniref:lytic transglycosylase domain-containing protein n=1 Tax=Pseudomonas veronii TaxID=76761 RepID=UPI0015A28616|nr:lytic transglycosylase domain-containing protein [Pseudomonas veronii]
MISSAIVIALAMLGAWGSCFAAPASNAAAHRQQAVKRPLTAECMRFASQSYGIHQDILYAILLVEGGTVGRDSGANKNGTYDIGLFQINSMHRKTFESLGISEEELRDDGCTNTIAAAWHLKRVLTPEVLKDIRTQDDYLRAIALYHSATPEFNKIYAAKLRKAFERIYASDAK